ncbi:MAG: protease complex subunit PrcB family protein [Pseudomonadaceae bacterium]|nr:protease complex subunit PrcB family protein [Pseudomonadaceae bacterium]
MLAGLCWILSGCQAGTPITAVELFSHANCQGVSKGIQQIQFADLATIRNVQLLSSPATRAEDQSDTQSQLDDVLLFVVSNGNQPTPGYGLDLTATETTNDEITFRYRWRTPAADAVLAQVMTSPCTVIQLDAHPDLTAVNAWLDGTLLGRVELKQPN